MLKKTLTFENFFGENITEDFYFNLSKSEIIDMGAGGYEQQLQKLLKTENVAEMLAAIKDIVQKAVGKRSEDGRRFLKTSDITDDFMQSGAFDELFMELVTDDTGKKVTEFFSGLLPKNMDGVKASPAPVATTLPVDPPKIEDPTPWITENREPTPMELRTMSKEQMVEAFQRKASPAVVTEFSKRD